MPRELQPCGTPGAYLRRAYCSWFGHAWSPWSDWRSLGWNELEHERQCCRCAAIEVQRDGEIGVIYAGQ